MKVVSCFNNAFTLCSHSFFKWHSAFSWLAISLRWRRIYEWWCSTLPKVPMPNGVSTRIGYYCIMMCFVITIIWFTIAMSSYTEITRGRKEEANSVLIRCPEPSICFVLVCMKGLSSPVSAVWREAILDPVDARAGITSLRISSAHFK